MGLPVLFALASWSWSPMCQPRHFRNLPIVSVRQLAIKHTKRLPSNLELFAKMERGDKRPPAKHVVKFGQELELEIQRMSAGGGKGSGMGIAWYNGQVVFVEGAFPHSTVKARVKKVKKDFAEARLLEVLTPSPDAVDPPCKFVEPGGMGCGGCKLQEISYSAQLRIKEEQVNRTMAAVVRDCGQGPDTMRPIIAADKTLRFRNRMDFSFKPSATGDVAKAQGGLPVVGAQMAIGLHRSGAWKTVVDIDHCLLQSELADRVFRRAREWFLSAPLTAWDPEAQSGYLRELGIRSGGEPDTEREQIMVHVITSLDSPSELQPLADLLVEAFGAQVRSVVNSVVPARFSTPAPDNVRASHVLAGAEHMTARVRGLDFVVSPASFFQTNPGQTEVLYRLVEELCQADAETIVYDLYCGTGTIGLSVARNTEAKRVVGFEIVEAAVADARRNGAANGVAQAEFVCGDLAELLSARDLHKEFGRPHVAIIDPPRPGMHPQCVKDVVKLFPRRIVYVSCNPSTQARDIALLHNQGGYRLISLHPVDMFPHSPHVETVALLERD